MKLEEVIKLFGKFDIDEEAVREALGCHDADCGFAKLKAFMAGQFIQVCLNGTLEEVQELKPIFDRLTHLRLLSVTKTKQREEDEAVEAAVRCKTKRAKKKSTDEFLSDLKEEFQQRLVHHMMESGSCGGKEDDGERMPN